MKKLIIHKKIIEEIAFLNNEMLGMVVGWLIIYNETGIQDKAPDKVAGIISKIQDIIKHNDEVSEIRKMSGRKGGNPILVNQNFCLTNLDNQNDICLTKNQVLLNQNESNNDFCLTNLVNQNEISDNNNINNNTLDNINILNNNKEKINKKEKNRKDLEKRAKAFYDSLIPFIDNPYPKEMLREFYDYWSEPNKSYSRMKWEQQTTWDLARRLARWENNDKKRNYGNNKPAKPIEETAADLIDSYLNGSRSRAELPDI